MLSHDTTKLDLSGLKCPLPALKTRKALKSLQPGDRLEVHCTDPLSVIDIPNLIQETGDKVEITERDEQPDRVPDRKGQSAVGHGATQRTGLRIPVGYRYLLPIDRLRGFCPNRVSLRGRRADSAV